MWNVNSIDKQESSRIFQGSASVPQIHLPFQCLSAWILVVNTYIMVIVTFDLPYEHASYEHTNWNLLRFNVPSEIALNQWLICV